MSYKERFIETIVDHSVANDWSTAKLEWDHICSDDIPDSNCICGQCITEVCTILNLQNGVELEVGNVCVTKFLDIDRKSDFKLIKKGIIDDSLLCELCQEGVINTWEFDFYIENKLKRKYPKVNQIKERIVTKSQNYIMRNKKKIRGINDPILFKNLKTENKMEHEHKVILLKHLRDVGVKIKDDGKIPDIMQDLKSILVSLKKLKEHYGNN